MTSFSIVDVARIPSHLLDHRVAALGICRFESLATAQSRQVKMLGRASADTRFHELAACDCIQNGARWRDCSAACHLATRLFRAELLLSEPALLTSAGGEITFFTLVPSRWRRQLSALKTLNPRRLATEVARALRGTGKSTLRATFDVEIDFRKDADGDYWAPHVHGIIVGASQRRVRDALLLLVCDDLNPRPLKLICTPPSEIPILLNYSTKWVDVQRTRYATPSGRLRWRKVPLRPSQQLELDAWRRGFPVGFAHTRIGFKRNGRFLVCTS